MTNREVKQKLISELDKMLPNVLQRVKDADITPFRMEEKTISPAGTRFFRLAFSLVIAFIIIAAGLSAAVFSNYTVAAVTFDFSQSHAIEIGVNRDMKVTEVTSVSKESLQIVKNLNLKSLQLDAAIKELLAQCATNSDLLKADITYEKVLLLSVSSNNEAIRKRVLALLSNETVQESYTFYSSVKAYIEDLYEDSSKKEAERYDITVAKYSLILKVKGKNSQVGYDMEQLARFSPGQLINLLEEKKEEPDN